MILKLVLLLLVFQLQTFAGSKMPYIYFPKTLINIGRLKLSSNSIISVKVFYKNIGYAPLIIYNINSSCGCTTSYWSKKPIIKGKQESILVKLSVKEKGFLYKSLFLKTNAQNSELILHIKGEIL